MAFDFSTAVNVKETDQGEAISTTKFDFTTAKNLEAPPTPMQRKPSVISKFVRESIKYSPADQFKTQLYLATHMPDREEGDNLSTYYNRVDGMMNKREEAIIQEGIGKVLEGQFQAAIGVGALTAPVSTAVGLTAFAVKDHFINFRRLTEEKFPNTSPELLDIVELADLAVTGALIGGGVMKGRSWFKQARNAQGQAKKVNIAPERSRQIQESPDLLPNEKADAFKTMGVDQKQIDASLGSNKPLTVPVERVVDLAEKPYWERLKTDLMAQGKPTSMVKFDKTKQPGFVKGEGFEAYPTPKDQTKLAKANFGKEHQAMLQEMKQVVLDKKLKGQTVSRLKKFLEIENIKKAPPEKIKALTKMLKDLNKEDKFISEKQAEGLKDIIKDLSVPEITPKRILIEEFGAKTDILEGILVGKIDPKIAPTVEIKRGQPLIAKIVDKATDLWNKKTDIVQARDKKFDKLITAAEKERAKLLPLGEKVSRKLVPRGVEAFEAMSGENVQLTKSERGVVAYLRNFFKKQKEYLEKTEPTAKFRKNYIPHMESTLLEKIGEFGLLKGIKSAIAQKMKGKKAEIPIDLMLELDNIIGSKKFFKYMLERKGGVHPSKNIRKILHDYSNLIETKKVMDQILPEGQAVTKLLLKDKGAAWMQTFLQNLKGRGLDWKFRSGPMGWVAKVADAIIDMGYIKLLGLSKLSPLKNLVAGEVNSWITMDFPSYLRGKQRMITHPKKAIKLAQEYGALEGTFAEYSQKGIGKLKKAQDFTMLGQRIGEYEIRSSIFSGMLTEAEWTSGKITPERFHAIKNVIAATQGMFSKTESPLYLQTFPGRAITQMNRWRITNAFLLKKITNEAFADIKAGKYNTKATRSLGKTLVAYGSGMYLSAELAKAGYYNASKIAENMAELINGIVSLFSRGELIRMFADNPTLSFFKETSNSIMDLADYIGVPGSQKPRQKGLEDTYIAGVQTIEDIKVGLDNL